MRASWTGFCSALLFITILPAGRTVTYSPVAMIRFFPVVGLLLGSLLAGLDMIAARFWPPAAVAVLDVFFLVAVTGAFHLDGLGDTADGIFSHRSRERALEIMKDSRTGMMGLVAVVCCLGLKTAGIYSLKTVTAQPWTALLLLIVPAYARAAMIFGIKYMNYGREKTGTGLDLFTRGLARMDFVFFVIPVAVSLFLGYKGLVLNAAFAITLVGVLGFYKTKMGCITGDMLGALCETMETVLFLAAGAALL